MLYWCIEQILLDTALGLHNLDGIATVFKAFLFYFLYRHIGAEEVHARLPVANTFPSSSRTCHVAARV